MLKLGLTGSIATGKSTVLRAFADLGVPTFSSDEVVHELYEGEAVPAVRDVFPDVIHGGKVDRRMLSARLIARPGDLKTVEAIVHPLVRQRISAFLRNAAEKRAPLAVVDVPLLFESGYDYGFDAVAVTVVDEDTQRKRAMVRPGMTVEKLDTILARQLPQAEKKRRATYVFDTSGPVAETQEKVRELVEKLAGP